MMETRELKKGTIVYGTYEILTVLGLGGFGITYQAIKCATGETVALKEYFPLSLAIRQQGTENLFVAQQDMAQYIHGKKRFMQEATILKEYCYLQGIVKVFDCFECNETAYIVMEYIDGITLKEYVASHGVMSYSECVDLLKPVLKSMVSLHRHSVIHRDISPDNIMLGLDNEVYLIDFGAAKEVEYGKTTTVLLKAGYAPPEQYLHDGDLGAWTDVYAICATIYTLLSGKVPTDAVARLQGKELVPLSECGVELEEWKWNAIAKGMDIRAAVRYRNVELLYDALTIEPRSEDVLTVAGDTIEPSVEDEIREINETEKDSISSHKVVHGNVFRAILLLCVATLLYFGNGWARNVFNNDLQQEETNQIKDERVDGTENAAIQLDEDNTLQEKITLCRMPDVVGMDESVAKKRIQTADKSVVVRIEKVYSEDVALGVVIEQSVKADTQYNLGSIEEIILTVSGGRQLQQSSDIDDASKTAGQTGSTNATHTKTDKQDTKEDFDIESEEEKMVDFYFD